MSHLTDYFNIATAVVAAASAIANLFPTSPVNQYIALLGKIVNTLALNWTSSTK